MKQKSTTPSRRSMARQATRDEILDTARQQMATAGASALSLRAIAREMQMTAPALYRYFKDRDDLVTALIAAAYNSLADMLQAARDARPVDDPAGRLFATCLAYRTWALAHPQDYALIFGTPIPGYVAPFAETQPAAKRSMDVFVGILEEATRAGKFKPTAEYRKPSRVLQAQLTGWKKSYAYTAPTSALYIALVGWSRSHGLILLELFNHLEPFFSDINELYRVQVMELLQSAGFKSGDR